MVVLLAFLPNTVHISKMERLYRDKLIRELEFEYVQYSMYNFAMLELTEK